MLGPHQLLKKWCHVGGEALFVDYDEDEPAGAGRVCIKTSYLNKIHGVINV